MSNLLSHLVRPAGHISKWPARSEEQYCCHLMTFPWACPPCLGRQSDGTFQSPANEFICRFSTFGPTAAPPPLRRSSHDRGGGKTEKNGALFCFGPVKMTFYVINVGSVKKLYFLQGTRLHQLLTGSWNCCKCMHKRRAIVFVSDVQTSLVG